MPGGHTPAARIPTGRSRKLTSVLHSPNLFLRWEILHVIGQRFGVDRPVIHPYAGGCLICPCQCVLHPGLVEPLWKVLAEVSAAALLPVERSGDRDGCLR